MTKTYKLAFLAMLCAFVVTACHRSASEGSARDALMRVIPSDACALVICPRLSTAFETVPAESNPFSNLEFGDLASAPIIISFHWTGELTPMLAIDAGKSQGAARKCAALVTSAAENSLETFLSTVEDGRSVLLVSTSKSVIESAERHRENRTSLLDIDGMAEAVEAFHSKTAVVVLKNDSVSHLIPKDFLGSYFKRPVLTGYLKAFSEWTVMNLADVQTVGRGEYQDFDVRMIHGDDPQWNAYVFEDLPCGEIKISGLLPQGTVFVLDQSFADCAEYMEKRRKNLDSAGKLNSFNNACASYRRSTGKDPLTWLEETDIREVAKVKWKDEEVLLVRPARPMLSHDIRYNRYRGFVPLLFGQAYGLADDSYSACIGNWLVFGNSRSIKHFLSSELHYKGKLAPSKSSKLLLLADDVLLAWDKEGLHLELYRNY